MAKTTGFRIRNKGSKTAVCTECASKLGIKSNLQSDSDVEELDTKQFASELCISCEKDITQGNGGSIDYPEEIAILLEQAFKGRGDRFGGVVPHIDSNYEVEELADGVKHGTAIRTQFDPVVVSLTPDEKSLRDELVSFLDTLTTTGRIRYDSQEFTDEDGDIAGYEVTAFVVQN